MAQFADVLLVIVTSWAILLFTHMIAETLVEASSIRSRCKRGYFEILASFCICYNFLTFSVADKVITSITHVVFMFILMCIHSKVNTEGTWRNEN